jgi:hypothetical protein
VRRNYFSERASVACAGKGERRRAHVVLRAALLDRLLREDVAGAEEDGAGRALRQHWSALQGRAVARCERQEE